MQAVEVPDRGNTVAGEVGLPQRIVENKHRA
jgi:hypothetical protein